MALARGEEPLELRSKMREHSVAEARASDLVRAHDSNDPPTREWRVWKSKFWKRRAGAKTRWDQEARSAIEEES